MITLGHAKNDNINRMITLTDYFYLVVFNKWDAADNININRLSLYNYTKRWLFMKEILNADLDIFYKSHGANFFKTP